MVASDENGSLSWWVCVVWTGLISIKTNTKNVKQLHCARSCMNITLNNKMCRNTSWVLGLTANLSRQYMFHQAWKSFYRRQNTVKLLSGYFFCLLFHNLFYFTTLSRYWHVFLFLLCPYLTRCQPPMLLGRVSLRALSVVAVSLALAAQC